MIIFKDVYMDYLRHKRFREYILKPFKKLKRFRALNCINVKINQGERIAILGPNGAGKTTLLKLTAGLLLPSKGKVLVNNYDTLKENDMVRKSVGMVMNEERSFYWRLTARENLEFFGALENMYGQILKDQINELLEFVGLQDNIDKKVSDFSSGMKQRLAIARGLLSSPENLILDEPTRALDPVASVELIDFIKKNLNKDKNRTLLLATHNLEEAQEICNRVIIINNGQIKSDKKIDEINTKNIKEYYLSEVNN